MPRNHTRRPSLTPRQSEVVRLVSLGCSSAEIAKILGVGRSTVDNYKYAAKRVLGADKAALITRLAIKHKYTSLNDKLSPEEVRLCGDRQSGKAQDGAHGLSVIQIKIVRLTSLGCSAFDIAAILGMDAPVVINQKLAAQQHLGVNSSALLTRLAFKLGITSGDDHLSKADAKKAGLLEPRSYSRNARWVPPLTRRRKQVIRLTSLGCKGHEIAAILGIPESSETNDRHAIARILGSGKATFLTRYAITNGISPLEDELTPTEMRKSRRYAGR